MTMASSSGESSSEPTSDLASLISKGTVDIEVLQLYAEKGQIDIPDKDGKTPLMFACLKSLEDTVKFLLANGANPNSKCFKEGNTPMHYACMIEEQKEDDSLSGIYYNPFKWMTSKIAIIKLLLGSGARAVQDNLNGWSPPCVAALYMLKDVVDFFLSMDADEIPLELKIKATEILGVSQATLSTLDQHFDCEDAFHSFSRAISFRQGASLPKAQSETSELAACFSKVSLQEYHTEEEFELIKEFELIEEFEVALKAHAFLVGDRLFPQNLKQRYLYPSLTSFAYDLMWEVNMLDEGLQVLKCALGLEHQGELKLGSVVSNLAQKLCESCVFEDEKPNHQYLQCIRDLLCEYESILDHVHIDSLSDNSDSLMKSFGEILFDEAFYCSTVDILKSTLQAIEKLVKVIRGRIRKENPDKYHELSSVTFKVMDLLTEAFVNNMYSGIDSRSLLRVKFVILKILLSDTDSASYMDSSLGGTLLHFVAYSVSVARDLEHLEDLAWAFVRHGCPIDVVNMDGETARDILEKDDMYDPDSDPLCLTLMSPPTTVLTLEEIAIRAILRHNLNYQEILPPSLCEMIEGEVKDSDLVRSSEASGSVS